MAKLVVLSEGLKGKSHELKVDRTTIGRVEDNTFQIAEPSVSSHHCEVLLKGSEVVIHDLDSTNGTFINGEKVSEAPLKQGQTLRLGQIELRLEDGPAAAETPSAATPAPAPKKASEQTATIQQGVSLSELEQGPVTGLDTASKAFSKKSDEVSRYFVVGGVIIAVVILGIIIVLAATIK